MAVITESNGTGSRNNNDTMKNSSSSKTTTFKKSRDPLSPKPILDRKLFCKALKEGGIVYKDGQHLDNFYQLLHRQQYPSISEFVKEYNRLEIIRTNGSSIPNPKEEEKSNTNNYTSIIPRSSRPVSFTKNPIGKRLKNIRQLPKSFLDFLVTISSEDEPSFVTMTSRIATQRTSSDGTTTKLAIELQDGHLVESVIMRHNSRATLCVSSQVGCAMGCTFCATGTMGIRGNLCSGEILEQLVHASFVLNQDDEKGIRNIVFMGMGEPLNNYNNVVEACRVMMERKVWNLAHGHVTVSTVGVTPKMRQLTRELPQVNLALSLHAPNQKLRESIVPTARTYPIEDMVQALDDHMQSSASNNSHASNNKNNPNKPTSSQTTKTTKNNKRKKAMIEYVMLEGDTSTLQSAHELGKLCENRHLVVNLIPYNKTNVKDVLSCPSEEQMMEFKRIVSSYGAFCTIRRTMGADIAGACGQLAVEEEEKQNLHNDIEDGPFFAKKKKNCNNDAVSKKSKRISKAKSSPIVVSKNENDDDASTLKGDSDGNKNTMALDSSSDLEHWIKPLAIATGIAGSFFIISTFMLLSGKRKNR